MRLAFGILAMRLVLDPTIQSGANADKGRRDYGNSACLCREDDAVFLPSVGGMDQRHNRSVARNMPLGSEYQ